MDVANRGRELGYIVQVSCLPWRMTIGASVEGVCQGFVIRQNMKVTSLQKMTEVFDGQVDCQKFPVEGAVASLCVRHLFREE